MRCLSKTNYNNKKNKTPLKYWHQSTGHGLGNVRPHASNENPAVSVHKSPPMPHPMHGAAKFTKRFRRPTFSGMILHPIPYYSPLIPTLSRGGGGGGGSGFSLTHALPWRSSLNKTIFVVLDVREMGREQKQGGGGRVEEAKVSFLPPFFCSRPISRASKNKKIGFLVQKTPRKRLLRRLPKRFLR